MSEVEIVPEGQISNAIELSEEERICDMIASAVHEKNPYEEAMWLVYLGKIYANKINNGGEFIAIPDKDSASFKTEKGYAENLLLRLTEDRSVILKYITKATDEVEQKIRSSTMRAVILGVGSSLIAAIIMILVRSV